VTPRQRLQALPEAPTVAESGLPGYDVTTWYGVFVSGRTERATANRLAQETSRAVTQQQMRAAISANGMDPASNTPAEFARLVQDDIAKWAKVVKATGARVD